MAAKTAAAAAWLALALLAGTCNPFTMPRHGHRRHQRRGAAVGEQEVEQKPIVRTAAGALQVGRSEIQTLVFEGDYVVHYERGVCQYAGRLQERDDDDGDGGGDGDNHNNHDHHITNNTDTDTDNAATTTTATTAPL